MRKQFVWLSNQLWVGVSRFGHEDQPLDTELGQLPKAFGHMIGWANNGEPVKEFVGQQAAVRRGATMTL